MFLKHPAWLWLKKHNKAKLPEPDANLQAIFDAGHEFEEYAEKRFEAGVTLGFESYDEYLNLPNRTKEAWDGGVKTIFQGRFESGPLTFICDVIDRVKENTVDLYEIKSSTKVKPEHIPDLAFQVVVLESLEIKVNKVAVIHVNGAYVKDGDVDPVALTAVADVTEDVKSILDETKDNIKSAIEIINAKEMPDPSPSKARMGSLNEWMDIYKNLGNEVDSFSIYNLIAPGIKRLKQLEEMGIKTIEEIPDDFDLTPRQQMQVLATKRGERIINQEKLKEFLGALKYPLHFLDYETAMRIVPMYDGTRPYQQIPFQYSLHVIEKQDGDVEHYEYLHRDDDHPVPELLQKLKEHIRPSGDVLVWYKTFEMKRNEEMGEMFPEYRDFLKDVNDRTIDLMQPFSEGAFVDKDFQGSTSIKNVLPVMVPEMNYKHLDIQEGGSAQREWVDGVIKKKAVNQEKLFNDLVEYCKMDTLAMVEIWRRLGSV